MTAGVGNYVTDNPSNLGKYVTADTMTRLITFVEPRGFEPLTTRLFDSPLTDFIGSPPPDRTDSSSRLLGPRPDISFTIGVLTIRETAE